MRRPKIVIKTYRGLIDSVISNQKIKAVIIDYDEPSFPHEVITEVDKKFVSNAFKRIK